jgi:drug/metabolite transporter (DMT)-like permease
LIKKKEIFIADIALVFVALFWGIGFVAMKEAIKIIPLFYLLAMRFFLSSLITALIFRKKIRHITYHDIKSGLIIGIFLFLGFVTQTLGLQYTTAGKLAFLTCTYVVIVPFQSWFVQKIFPGMKSFIASAICLLGMAFLTLQKDLSIGAGDILGLICAFFFAGHIVSVEYYAKKKDPIVMTVIQMGFVALFSFFLAIFLEIFPVKISNIAILSLLYTVFFCTIFAFLIQNVAQKITPSTHTSIILSLESVFGALSGIIMIGEKFTLFMFIGSVLILIAVIISKLHVESD